MVEPDALRAQEPPLERGALAGRALAHLAARIHDSLPRHTVSGRNGSHREADDARRGPHDARDLPVGRDLSARDLAGHDVHPREELAAVESFSRFFARRYRISFGSTPIFFAASRKIFRPMTIRWTWLVPS